MWDVWEGGFKEGGCPVHLHRPITLFNSQKLAGFVRRAHRIFEWDGVRPPILKGHCPKKTPTQLYQSLSLPDPGWTLSDL